MKEKDKTQEAAAALPERFTFNGWAYYQQHRKCGNTSCRCALGFLHGPYWYRRNIHDGRIHYGGKDPFAKWQHDITAYLNTCKNGWLLEGKQRELREQIRGLNDKLSAINALLSGEEITGDFIRELANMGYQDCTPHNDQ